MSPPPKKQRTNKKSSQSTESSQSISQDMESEIIAKFTPKVLKKLATMSPEERKQYQLRLIKQRSQYYLRKQEDALGLPPRKRGRPRREAESVSQLSQLAAAELRGASPNARTSRQAADSDDEAESGFGSESDVSEDIDQMVDIEAAAPPATQSDDEGEAPLPAKRGRGRPRRAATELPATLGGGAEDMITSLDPLPSVPPPSAPAPAEAPASRRRGRQQTAAEAAEAAVAAAVAAAAAAAAGLDNELPVPSAPTSIPGASLGLTSPAPARRGRPRAATAATATSAALTQPVPAPAAAPLAASAAPASRPARARAGTQPPAPAPVAASPAQSQSYRPRAIPDRAAHEEEEMDSFMDIDGDAAPAPPVLAPAPPAAAPPVASRLDGEAATGFVALMRAERERLETSVEQSMLKVESLYSELRRMEEQSKRQLAEVKADFDAMLSGLLEEYQKLQDPSLTKDAKVRQVDVLKATLKHKQEAYLLRVRTLHEQLQQKQAVLHALNNSAQY